MGLSFAYKMEALASPLKHLQFQVAQAVLSTEAPVSPFVTVDLQVATVNGKEQVKLIVRFM